jgi:hypothetical protein
MAMRTVTWTVVSAVSVLTWVRLEDGDEDWGGGWDGCCCWGVGEREGERGGRGREKERYRWRGVRAAGVVEELVLVLEASVVERYAAATGYKKRRVSW